MKSQHVYGAVSGTGIGTGFAWLYPWTGFLRMSFCCATRDGHVLGFSFGHSEFTPGVADRSEQLLNLDQWRLDLLEIGFAEAIRHIPVEVGELEAHFTGRLVIENTSELPYNLHRLCDGARPFDDPSVSQVPSRIAHRLNGALVSEMNELQRARGLDQRLQIGVVAVHGHDSYTGNVSDDKPGSSVFSPDARERFTPRGSFLGQTAQAQSGHFARNS
jgi:hypothetical protein